MRPAIKRLLPALLLLLLLPLPGRGELHTGFYISLGQMHYSFKSFDGSQVPTLTGKPTDLFLGVSLWLNNRWELNLTYNRSTGTVEFGGDRLSFDKDGFGLELGKVLPIHLFKKGGFNVSLDIAAGLYGTLSPSESSTVDWLGGESTGSGDSWNYQAGFYWTVRTRYMIGGKAAFHVAYKSLLPVKGNEFHTLVGKHTFLFKSFITIGVAF